MSGPGRLSCVGSIVMGENGGCWFVFVYVRQFSPFPLFTLYTNHTVSNKIHLSVHLRRFWRLMVFFSGDICWFWSLLFFFAAVLGGSLRLTEAVVTSRLPCAIVESPRRHKSVPFVNIASLRSCSIKRRQWKHKLDYYGVVFAHLATGCGIKAKDPSGLDSDRWIPHSRCCENPARAKALAGFSRHLSAGFTNLNPAPRGLSL